MAAHIEQRRLGAVAQRDHIDTFGDGEQDVPSIDQLAGDVERLICCVVAPAFLVRRFRNQQILLEEFFNGMGRGLAKHAVCRRNVALSEQAGCNRLLAKQFGACALAQFVGGQHLIR